MIRNLIILIFLLLRASQTLGACLAELISSPLTNSCNQPLSVPITSSPGYISGTRTATVIARVEVLSVCGYTPSSSLKIDMMSVRKPTSNLVTLQPQTATTVTLGSYNSAGTSFNSWTMTYSGDIWDGGYNEFGIVLDFPKSAGNQLKVSVMSSGFEDFVGVTVHNSVTSFANTLTFDDITFHFCCNYARTSCFSCKLHSLTLVYRGIDTDNYAMCKYWFGITPILLGHYRFKDASTSYSLTDSKGLIGTAYRGDSASGTPDTTNSPAWAPQKAALSFTSASQFVTIPAFTMSSSGPSNLYSMTLTFWIYRPSGSSGYIWRRSSNDLSTDKFALKVTSTGALQGIMGAETRTTTTYSLLNSQWLHVIVHYRMSTFAGGKSNRIFFLRDYNPMDSYTPAMTTTGTITFADDDAVRLGGPTGFVGMIADLRIYSPGTIAAFNTGFCSPSSSCSKHLGVTEPPVCLAATCSSSCGSCFDDADTSCLTCGFAKYFYERKCQACPSSMQVASGGDYCSGCTSYCATCNPSTLQCEACTSRFLYQGQCLTSCPVNTFTYQQQCYDSCPANTFGYQQQCVTSCPVNTFTYQQQCLTSCPVNTFTYQQQCYDSCPANTFGYQQQCVTSCPVNTFTYQQQCLTSCPVNTFTYQQQCYDSCPANTFGYQQQCVTSCPVNTFTYQQQCLTSCPANTFTYQQQCVASCPVNTFTYQQQCLTSCPANTFPNQQQCYDSCPANTFGYQQQCVTSCPVNTFTYQQQCLTSCPANTFTYQQQCYDSCPANTFGYQQQCVISCPVNTFTYQQQCLSSCPSATYPSNDATCTDCSANCETCTSQSICQQCQAGYVLVNSACVASSSSSSGASVGVIVGACCGGVASLLVIYILIRLKKRGLKVSSRRIHPTVPASPNDKIVASPV